MKDWKEVPHLFVNGEFNVKIGRLLGSLNQIEWHEESERYLIYVERRWFDISNCTLIARKIDDMTLEEVRSMPHLQNIDSDEKDFWIKRYINQANKDTMFLGEAINLKSIGVYPLPQSHFGKTVIDIKTIDS